MEDEIGGNDLDIDALVADAESNDSTNAERPMSAEPEQAAAPAAAPQEFDFTWNGKQIKAPINDPRLKQWAAQGYDYNHKVGELKTKEQKLAEMEQSYKPYREVDEYAKQNKDWWEHVQKSYEQRAQQQGLDPENPLTKELTTLRQELAEIKKFKDDSINEKTTKQREQEDTALRSEIESIRKTYSDLDFDSPDETGKGLELRVLEFASQKGIQDFKTAFIAFNHDKLIQLAAEKAKESVTKEQMKNKKAGLLGKTPAPTKALSEPRDLKNQSYDQILEETKRELGLI
jgi:hypothetical protein